ncbi:MAG TPA: Holliday junction branch migration protein RuvA [Bacteroidales bacterium]|nr:Holliday junction branch migration protein RuvA [Bacteroidales bacterium]
MYDYIEGALKEKNPSYCVVETAGIGYFIQISLYTYSQLQTLDHIKLYLHQVVREDALLLFGFSGRQEREMFRQLITVAGIGANTARMMLSSMSPEDIRQAVLGGNTALLQGIKGIGTKTAQRVIIELRDKIGKEKTPGDIFALKDNRLKDEALTALIMLGFNKNEADKVISRILLVEESLTLEELIKKALKQL